MLALVVLVRSDKMTKSSTTTSTSPTTTTSPPKTDKEKRTLTSEAALHNLDFFSPNNAHTRYVTQDYLQLPATNTQQYVQIPASKAQEFAQYTEQKAQQQYIQVPEPKIQQYVQSQDPKLQQYVQSQEPKLQQYVQAQNPKIQQYVQAQDQKLQQYLQAQNQKVQQYVQARDPKIQQYVQEKEQQYVQAKEQQYVQVPTTKVQPVNYQIPEDKKQQQPSYSIQYVPAQHVSHSVGVLPKYQQTTPVKQSQKYQFVSKTQQQSPKTAAPLQNLILPQQPYVFPSLFGYNSNSYFGAPQYTSPSYNLFNTSPYQYLYPSHHQTSTPYNLQPVVMMFTLPGGHYLNSHAGQNALLTFLQSPGKSVATAGQASGSTGLHSAATTVPTVPYLLQGQQLSYLVPPVQQTPVSQLVPQVRIHLSIN